MRVHLRTSDEPLHSGDDLGALCGLVVKQAHFVFVSEDIRNVSELSPLMFCRYCLALPKTDGRLLYGMITGEQAKRLANDCR
jgi:hypothetical protein